MTGQFFGGNVLKILAFLITLSFAFYTVDQYGQNTACYEIVDISHPSGKILLDKCEGHTFTMTKASLADDDGKNASEYTYRWVRIDVDYDSISVWEE